MTHMHGTLILSGLFKIIYIFTGICRHFQGCLRVWSRRHQVRGHPCKLGKLPIFYLKFNFLDILPCKKNQKIYFVYYFHK